MHVMRYCVISILLTIALLLVLSVATASDNHVSPTCAAKSALDDFTISSVITVFAAGLLAGFNRCLLAMLAFLASSMLASTGRRKDIFWSKIDSNGGKSHAGNAPGTT